MPRIFQTNCKTQLKILEMFGCKYKRKEGLHYVLTCPNAKRAVVIPEYDEICDDPEIQKIRTELFGNLKSHGGLFKELIDTIDNVLYTLISDNQD